MSAVMASVDVASLTMKKQQVTEEVLVGKDILELLAGAMYAEPLTIYREYVQNAADAIDEAREAGLPFDYEPGVVISIDVGARTVTIRDNGASIPAKDFVRRLTTIGASGKRGKTQRGFRGVGRLSGLGYCQEIIFRGRAAGEGRVTEMRWDGRRLRELLRDASFGGGLADLVRSVVEVSSFSGEGYPSRFFEVELRKLSRLRGDLLLDAVSIRSYLSQTAPVPFDPWFTHGPRIDAFLRSKGAPSTIGVRIAGEEQPIYHRATDIIELSPKVNDRISGVEFLELLGEEGEVVAYGWLLDHAYSGAVPKRLGLGGIRLRSGNIQVGGDDITADLFVEPRFAAWAIGDIHIQSARILPNARRDAFEPTVQYAHLQDELRIIAKRLTQTIRDRSDRRNRLRKVHSHLSVVDEWLAQAQKEKPAPVVAARIREIIFARVKEATKEVGKLAEATPDRAAAEVRIKAILAQQKKLLPEDVTGPTGKRRSPREKAVEVALNVILEHASSPHAGLLMSKRLLSAFES